ncbi:MAG: hypothetical protein H6733_13645 [Alphaproteobacteria bacterium]|nr:hypothetical protein [Alphaproteobacteria bacterium]
MRLVPHGVPGLVARVASLACLACATTPGSVDPDTDPVADTDAVVDTDTDTVVHTDTVPDTDTAPVVLRGRFESAGPVRTCGQIADWSAPDGLLLRMHLDVCGDDMDALAATIVANLDAVEARGGRAILSLAQGPFLPASWLARCATFDLQDPLFSGPLCLPWDAAYQQDLSDALVDHLGPAVRGHPALAAVYFSISTMTNGAELHFRVDRDDFPYPGDAVFGQAYTDVMDLFARAFDVPILLEGGHCLWLAPPRGSGEDCALPLALYRHARDLRGAGGVGLAMWNCAERFWAGDDAIAAGTRPLWEEAAADGVSLGCQTVASFTEGACQFSDADVADYGTVSGPGTCAATPPLDVAGACVDTLDWFRGAHARATDGLQLHGTWGELWSVDWRSTGPYATNAGCRAAVDALAP